MSSTHSEKTDAVQQTAFLQKCPHTKEKHGFHTMYEKGSNIQNTSKAYKTHGQKTQTQYIQINSQKRYPHNPILQYCQCDPRGVKFELPGSSLFKYNRVKCLVLDALITQGPSWFLVKVHFVKSKVMAPWMERGEVPAWSVRETNSARWYCPPLVRFRCCCLAD